MSESSCLISPGKRSHPPLQEMLILCSSFWSFLSVKGMIHFLHFLFRKRSIALSVKQSSSPSPPPGISKLNTPTIYAYWICIGRGFLAWGPNNFSLSMIWSWRTRSNSRTGLGAELLLPAQFHFVFAVFSTFPPCYHNFYLFFLFPFFFVLFVEMDLFSLNVFCVFLPLLRFLCFIYNKLVIRR